MSSHFWTHSFTSRLYLCSQTFSQEKMTWQRSLMLTTSTYQNGSMSVNLLQNITCFLTKWYMYKQIFLSFLYILICSNGPYNFRQGYTPLFHVWDTLIPIEGPCKIHLSKKRRHTRISNRFLDSRNLPTAVSNGKCRRVCKVRSSASTTVSFNSLTFTPTQDKDTLAHLHVLNWPRKCNWTGWRSLSA